MAADYRFETVWRLPVGQDRIRELLLRWGRGEEALDWWPGVRISAPRPVLRPGARIRSIVRSPLGYRLRLELRVTTVEPHQGPPARIAVSSSGALEGSGELGTEADGDGSLLRIGWRVRTTSGWMNALAPALRPAFAWAHGSVMRAGERGLRQRLAAQ